MNLLEQALAAEKMYALWKHKHPEAKGTFVRPEMIIANSKVRAHASGIESLQCGRGVAYIFHLDQPNVQQQYEQMQQEAHQGRLASIDLLIGFKESYEDSGQLGNLGWMITTANHPVSNYTPSEDDSYDPMG